MLKYFRYTLLASLLFIFTYTAAKAGDTAYIKVHFLYGSRPLKAYKKTEPKWFGGIMGGHAGIEGEDNKILSFVPSGNFHILADNAAKHSRYAVDSFCRFYARLGHQCPDSAKKAIVIIPVTKAQKLKFDSLSMAYLANPPYDYALMGMRCGAATYEILAQLGILEPMSLTRTWMKVLYPKIVRKELLKKAEENHWTVIRQKGTSRRKWEVD